MESETGERVLSRKQNKEYEQKQQKQPIIVQMNVNAMDAKSFHGYVNESMAAILGAISSAGADNHPSRRRR